MTKIVSKSRRRTPWSGVADATALQTFIDECTQNNYQRRHPRPTETGEADLLNSFDVNECRHCGGPDIQRFGYTANGIQRYRCKDCSKTFTILTNTIFDSHKIPLTEWLDFLLSIFGFWSFNLVSKGNRNAYNTTRYWMDKVFLVLRGYQDTLVLREKVQLDETFYKVRQDDIETIDGQRQYRGLSRNQICIGIACDDTNVICFVGAGASRPSKASLAAFGSRIEYGAMLSHDMEQAHNALVELLGLDSITYDSREIKKLPDRENPLNKINQYCRMLKKFLNAHSGFIREDIQDYLNLFSFMINPPNDKQEKVEKFMIRALDCRITYRYRD